VSGDDARREETRRRATDAWAADAARRKRDAEAACERLRRAEIRERIGLAELPSASEKKRS
jgi:hypothetical protein